MRGKHASRTERRSETGERGLRRASAWAGIVAPILFVALVAVESLLRAGYSQIADWVSYLGYGPNAALQDLNFLLFGSLSIVVAIGLGAALPRTRAASAQRAERLVAVSGVAVMIAGGSLLLVDALPAGVAFVTHTVASFVAFGAFLVAMSVMARSLKDADAAWGRYRRFSRWSAWIGAVLLATFVATMFGPYAGLTERMLIATLLIWIEGTGWKLHSGVSRPLPRTEAPEAA